MGILDLDPRWRALQDNGGVIDIGFDHPSTWPHGERGDAPFLKEGDDQLTSELCRVGDDRFVRCILALPIRGSEETLYIAAWAETDAATFYCYIDHLDGAEAPADCVAVLASDLGALAALDNGLALTFANGERPTATLTGITDMSLDALIALYEDTETLARGALKPS